MAQHETIVGQNRLRDALLSNSWMNITYDPVAAQKLMEIHQAKSQVLGISWYGARCLFRLFEKLSSEIALQDWNLDITSSCLPSPDHLFTLQTSSYPMSWIVTHIICPHTFSTQESLLFLFFGLTAHNSFPLIGQAHYFHSYTWNEQFSDTYTSLDQAICSDVDRIGRFIWWDIFCQNQHIKGDVAATFHQAINQVSHVLFSIPNLSSPQALGRVWCLYELTCSLSTHTTKLRLIQNYRTHQHLTQDPLLSIVDVKEASAFYSADKVMLLQLMEDTIPNGCEGVNNAIKDLFVPLYLHQCLFDITRDGNFLLFREVVERNGIRVKRVRRSDGTHLIHIAAAHQALEILMYLVGVARVDVTKKTKTTGRTALHEAARVGHVAICEALLHGGALVDDCDDDDETPLHYAAAHGHREVTQLLLTHGANPLLENRFDELTPRQSCAMGRMSVDDGEEGEKKRQEFDGLLDLLTQAEWDWKNKSDSEERSSGIDRERERE
jgi:hypothetical protein